MVTQKPVFWHAHATIRGTSGFDKYCRFVCCNFDDEECRSETQTCCPMSASKVALNCKSPVRLLQKFKKSDGFCLPCDDCSLDSSFDGSFTYTQKQIDC